MNQVAIVRFHNSQDVRHRASSRPSRAVFKFDVMLLMFPARRKVSDFHDVLRL